MSQKSLSTLFLDQSNDLIWIIDPDFLLVYANQAYLNLMEEVSGKKKRINEPLFTEGFVESYTQNWREYYKRAFGGEYFEVEDQFFNPNKNEALYSTITFKPIKGENSEIVAVACQSNDIQHLVKQRKEANQLMDASLDIFCTINEAGNLVYVSAAAEKNWGYKPEELVGRPYIDLILDEDVNKTKEIAAAIENGHEIKTFCNRYRKKDGGIAYNLWSARWDEATNLMYCVARDNKEQIEQEEKIQQSEQRFKALVQEGSDLIGILNAEGKYAYVSPTSNSILGIAPQEFLGKSPFEFLHPDDKEKVSSSLQRISIENKVTIESFRFKNKNNDWRWMETVLTNMLENPAVKGIVANSRDITDEKHLKELNTQVRELAKIGSWELNFSTQKLYWSDIVHQLHETDPNTYVPDLEKGINFYKEEFQDLVRDNIRESFSKGESFDFEAILVTANRKERWVRVIGTPEFTNDTCSRISGSFQDIHKLKEAEIRLQSLAENLPGLVYQYAIYPDGTDALTNISGEVKKMWGFTAKEVMNNISLAWEQIKKGGDLDKVEASISKSIETRSKWNSRINYVMPDGELRTHLAYGTPDFLSDGTILFNSIVLDITDYAKNEELLEQTTEIAQVGSWEMDLIANDQNKMYWSPLTKKILEVEDDYNSTLTGGFEFYIGESRIRAKQAMASLIEEGLEFDEEFLLKTGKGNEKWIRVIGKSDIINEQCARVYGSIQDIHEQKIASLKFEKSSKALEDYKFALDQSSIVAITDKKGVITSVNDNFCTISKYKREEILGQTHSLINSKYHPPEFFTELWKTIASGKIWRGEIKNKAKDGSYYWVDTTIVPFLDKKNRPFQYLAIRFDITSRKEAEESAYNALIEKNNILESISDNFYALDEDFRFRYMNESCSALLQVDPLEILGKNIFEEHPNLLDTAFEQNLKHVKETKESVSFEFYYELFDRWFQENIYPTPSGLSVYFQDITDKKEAEQERNSLQVTLENSLNEIYIFNAETLKFSYANKGALDNLGYTEAELKLLTPIDIKPEHTAATFKKLVDPLISKEKGKIIFFTNHKRKDGSLYPVEVHLQLMELDENKRYLAVILDITERRKVEEENRFKANLLSMVRQGAIATNLDGEVKYWNKGAEIMYGWKEEEAIGKNIMQLTTLETNKEEARQIMEMLNKGKSWSGDFEVQKKDGTNFTVMITNSPIYDENNELKGIIGISTDITQEIKNKELLKQYTLELERSNEELEQFAFVTSHDLQEPLRMITSFMDQLKRKYEDQLDEKALQYIYFATDGAKRMKNIILDLLDYSRASKPSEDIEEVDLNEVISSYKQLRRKVIAENSAVIIAEKLPSIISYNVVLTQIFHGLLDNAIKYNREGVAPVIEIKAQEKENEWKFSVTDNGIGIDAQFYDKIFVIFQRLHNRNRYDGTGIGLSIVKRSVEFLDGQIWLSSTVGEGTTFFFTIAKKQNDKSIEK